MARVHRNVYSTLLCDLHRSEPCPACPVQTCLGSIGDFIHGAGLRKYSLFSDRLATRDQVARFGIHVDYVGIEYCSGSSLCVSILAREAESAKAVAVICSAQLISFLAQLDLISLPR